MRRTGHGLALARGNGAGQHRRDRPQPARGAREERALRRRPGHPGPGRGWDVRLDLRRFRCSAPGARPAAALGRGFVRLYVDGRPVALLHTPAHHLAAGRVPHGTHQITARLYADDGTAWAVHGKPIESTADITVSDAETATDRPANPTTSAPPGT
ncbi:hypothetical protein ACFQ3Z_11725 [Streptomyces nogalater]